jgi:hypothetical protein
MTGWASKAALLLTTAIALPALAQPVQLVPLPRGNRGEVPAIVQPAVPAAAASGSETDAASKPDSGPIEVSTLSLPDPSNVGTLGGDAGYGDDLWAGADRKMVERLVTLLPLNEQSAAARDMARRLLLTAARVPAGKPQAKSLIGLRADRLAAMGMAEAALGLARAAPSTLGDPKLARATAEAALLNNETKDACGVQQAWVREDSDPYWVKLGLLCRAADGDMNSAALVLSLVREQGIDDPAFLALGDLLTGVRGAKLDSLQQPSAMHAMLLRIAKRQPPADAWTTASPQVIPLLLDGATADADLRIAAAERAVAAGTLPPAALAKLYAGLNFPAEDRRDIPATVKKLSATPVRATALLYQAAAGQSVQVAQADLLKRLAGLAAERGVLSAVAGAVQPLLANMTPSEEVGFASPDLIRLALAAGDTRTAQRWYRWAVVRTAEQDKVTNEALRAAWPLAVLSGLETNGVQPAGWQRWLATLDSLSGEERQRRAALLLSLADALGLAVPADLLVDTLGADNAKGEMPPPPFTLRGLQQAADAGRRGETLLYTLLALDSSGPAVLDSGSTATIVAALRKVGLESDARRIALDKALAGGL